MNRLSFYLGIVCMCLVGCATTNKADTHGKEHLIELKDGVEFSTRMIGFNSSNAFQFDNTATVAFQALMDSIKPAILRFPGGTIGNFYHARSAGYGFRSVDTKWIKGNVGDHIRSLSERQAVREINYLDDFIRLCKISGSRTIYVFNIISGSTEELDFVLGQLSQNEIDVAGIELGNELYLKGYSDSIPNVQDYIRRCKPFADHIREKYPRIPIAAVAVPYSLFDKDILNEWNVGLQRANFYDAISIHVYPTLDEVNSYAAANAYMSYATEKLGQFATTNFPQRLKTLSTQFDNRKIWITEWNVLSAGTNVGNTMAQCYYILESLMSSCRSSKELEFSCYHNLYATDHAFSLLQTKPNKPDEITRNASYYPFLLMASMQEDSLIIFQDFVMPGADGVRITPVRSIKGDKIYLIISNKVEQERDLHLAMHIDSRRLSLAHPVRKSTISAGALYSSPGKSFFENNASLYEDHSKISELIRQFKYVENDTSGMHIAPFSISIVEFDLQKP
ncbi:MAG: hypothetical protein ACKVOK_14425 [Flavobacteriales bacterium]